VGAGDVEAERDGGGVERRADGGGQAVADEGLHNVTWLPPIPKANHPAQGMRAEYLVTPVVFALDPRLRYPIINGAERVQVLLRRIGVADDSLEAKYRALVRLIGSGGVVDAADLDQLGLEERIELSADPESPMRQLLAEQPEAGSAWPPFHHRLPSIVIEALPPTTLSGQGTTAPPPLPNKAFSAMKRLLTRVSLSLRSTRFTGAGFRAPTPQQGSTVT